MQMQQVVCMISRTNHEVFGKSLHQLFNRISPSRRYFRYQIKDACFFGSLVIMTCVNTARNFTMDVTFQRLMHFLTDKRWLHAILYLARIKLTNKIKTLVFTKDIVNNKNDITQESRLKNDFDGISLTNIAP